MNGVRDTVAWRQRLPLLIPPLILFVIVLTAYWSSRATPIGGDSALSIPLSRSIVYEHDLDLDEYRPLRSSDEWKATAVGPHIYTFFPVGASLLAAPFVALHDTVRALSNGRVQLTDGQLEWAIACIIAALTSVIVYLIARRSSTIKQSLLVALMFAFCTSAWSTASRALWQHTPSIFALALTLYLILLAQDRPWAIQFAGLPLAFSFISRPTNSISVVIITLLVALRYRRYFLQFMLWSALIAAPWMAFNWTTYHSLVSPYYQATRIGDTSRFLEAVLGNLVSPARGILTFSPVLLFCTYGLVLKIKGLRGNKPDLLLDLLLLLAIALHWFAISAFPHWWGGYSFGPRFFTDMLPYLMYFLIPVVALVASPGGLARPAVVLFGVLALVSFFIHYRGSTDVATLEWNHLPISVDTKPARLWDWYDLQFIRGIRALDPFIPPQVISQPSKISIVGSKANNGQVALKLIDGRYRNCDWKIEAPPGVVASVSSKDDARDVSLTLAVHSLDFANGSHPLGDLVISASRTGTTPPRPQRLAIPVQVRVFEHKTFLPLTAR